MLKHYLFTALRHFLRHKTTTAINVACLTLGLICFVLAFAIVSYFKYSDRHFENSGRIYTIAQRIETSSTVKSMSTIATVSWQVGELLKTDFPELDGVARASIGSEFSIAAGDVNDRAMISFADADFLKLFDLPFMSGDAKSALSEPGSAVVSDRLARRLFGTTNVLGKRLLVANSVPVSIRGVITEPRQPSHMSFDNSLASLRFEALVSTDVQQTIVRAQNPIFAGYLFGRINGGFIYYTYVRLPTGNRLSPGDFDRRLEEFSRRHSADQQRLRFHFTVKPLAELTVTSLNTFARTDSTGISSVALLMTLGIVILAVSCFNYANLATAQAVTRVREIVVRRAVGANRLQVVAQLGLEAAMLAATAMVVTLVALIVAFPVVSPQLQVALRLLFIGDAAAEFLIVVFISLIAVSIGASVYPALTLARIRPASALKFKSIKPGSRAVLNGLIVAQFATASVLLIGVLAMMQQNGHMRSIVSEMSPDPIVVIANGTKEAKITMELLRSELAGKPGIKSITGTPFEPWNLTTGSYTLVAKSAEPTARQLSSSEQGVSYDFFATLEIPLLAGRVFERTLGDDTRGGNGTQIANIVVDRALTEMLGWRSPQEAVGQILYSPATAELGARAAPSRIVGVVEDRSLNILNVAGRSTVYRLSPENAAIPLIRVARADLAAGLASIDAAWNKLAPLAPMKRRFLDEEFERNFQRFTLVTSLIATLATFSFAISAMGLIGIASLVATQRTSEVGIRKTLGARTSQIVAMLLRDFCKPVLAANLLVWPLAYIATQFYLSLFVQRISLSPLPFVASLLIVLLIACTSVLGPALRAAGVGPAVVLRNE